MLADKKLTSDSFLNKNIKSLPDNPSESGMTAKELKAMFDKSGEEVIANAVNEVIDELTGENGSKNIGVTGGGTVYDHILNRDNPHIVTASQTGAYTRAETDYQINKKLIEIGAADMQTAVYDPQGKKKDIFKEIKDNTVSEGTHFLNGTVHEIVSELPDKTLFTIRFKASADYTQGETFTLNGESFAVKPVGEETALPNKVFVTGDIVSVEVDGENKKINFKIGGSGMPKEWKEEATAKAYEDIEKYAPIVMQHYGDFEEGISMEPDVNGVAWTGMVDFKYHPKGQLLGCLQVSTFGTTGIGGGQALFFLRNDNTWELTSIDIGTPYSFDFSLDGKYLVATYKNGSYGKVIVYSVSDDYQMTVLKETTNIAAESGIIRDIKFIDNYSFIIMPYEKNAIYYSMDEQGNLTQIQSISFSTTSYKCNQRCVVSPDGTYIIIGSCTTTSPSSYRATMYKRNDSGTYDLVTYTSITNSLYETYCMNISPNGKYFACGAGIYDISNETFSKIVSPADFGATTYFYGVNWSPDSQYVCVALDTSPYIAIYKQDMLEKMPDPTILPTSEAHDIAISPDGSLLTLQGGSSSSNAYLRTYVLKAYNVVSNISKFTPSIVTWLPKGKIGMALEKKSAGEQIKVNLFTPLNTLG